jgi:hypothetical protein
MNNAPRDELLQVIAELRQVYPDWRLGQMLANLAMAAGRTDAGGVWDLEDSEALAAARRLLNRRRQEAASGV